MYFRDPLYPADGREMPDMIGQLLMTDRVLRAHGISQSVVPDPATPYAPIPSRLIHGLGVCRLALEVIDQLPMQYHRVFLVAALLHDVGSPAFSHSSEPFLMRDTGLDGESFLTEMLRGSQTHQALEEMQLKIEDITALVAGSARPVSEVLNGSMDIDNLDNVARFHLAAIGTMPVYEPLIIARAYRFDPTKMKAWSLDDSVYDQAMGWKEAREAVYNLIYQDPHLVLAGMLQRALYLEWSCRGLSREFYAMTDMQAMACLATSQEEGVRRLIADLMHQRAFTRVYDLTLEESIPDNLVKHAGDPLFRHELAGEIAEALRIPKSHMCVMVSRGRDRRKITIPFTDTTGRIVRRDENESRPIYRVKAWLHPDHVGPKSTGLVARIIRDCLL